MQTETADRISELTDAALEQLQRNLAAGKSETLKTYLATMAHFHRYSFGNQLLSCGTRSGPPATRLVP